MTCALRKIQHRSDAQDRYTENEDIRKGDDASRKFQKEKYPAFRPLQEDIIHSVCAGRDTLGLMPTGGGKSVTFQVPALAMEGICFVITPLIALMRDQVDNLRRVGIKATAVIQLTFLNV